jgi:hypothetical protein
MTFSIFIIFFFCKKVEYLSKSFRHVLLDIHVLHQITTKIGPKNVLFTNKHIFCFSGKNHQKSYKMIGSFSQFFDCEIIANKKDFIESLNKNVMWLATLKRVVFSTIGNDY